MTPARLLLPLAAAVALQLAACAGDGLAPDGEQAVGSSRLPIIGGAFDPGDPAVVSVGGFCTGTLIAPRVVLTAAHCVAGYIESGNTAVGSVRFGNGRDAWLDRIDIVDMAMHRLYAPPIFQAWDIAALRLAREAPAEIRPVPINRDPLSIDDVGISVRVVGFGVTDGATQEGAGTKRQVSLTLDEVTYLHIGVGTDGRNSCQGDSGGPTLARIDGEERIIGVTSFGSNQCRARSYMTRVDSHQDWVLEVLDAWDGPCALDGTCVTDGCRTVDPDCDVCGFDGTCGDECPEVDLDCPLAGRAGEACGDLYDCETRLCIEALDDPRLSYCSQPCDPARPLETCPVPLSACVEGEDGPVCAYGGATPGAQGADCGGGEDCRSGLCDPDHGICVEPCGGEGPACAAPFACEELGGQEVCTVPRKDSCSAAGGRGLPGPIAAGLLLLAAWLVGRRRRPAAPRPPVFRA